MNNHSESTSVTTTKVHKESFASIPEASPCGPAIHDPTFFPKHNWYADL